MDTSHLTPEQIEGIDFTDILTIGEIGKELHEATLGILETPMTAKSVEHQTDLRRAMRLKMDEAANHLSAKIADLEALKKELRVRKGYQSSDLERLESYKIGLYIKEKELRNRP